MKIRQGGFFIAKIHQLTGRMFSKRLKAYNIKEINQAQGRILFFLWQNDGISIQELAEATSLGKSTLTSMLDRLEASGHLKRVPCKEDRRKTLIQITDKDKDLKSAYEKVVMDVSSLFYTGFTEAEVDQFESYLARVYNNLQEAENQI